MVEPGMYVYAEDAKNATAMMGPNKYYVPNGPKHYVTNCGETFHHHFIDDRWVLISPAEVTQW